MLPYVFKVTKYDPADRDEHGHYVGAENIYSNHGLVEHAYLQAVAEFAEDAGVTTLEIRDPEVNPGIVNFGVEPVIDDQGLAGLFPPDLTGYHDGAHVPVSVGLELVRAMLRDNGAWCRLEVAGRFFVHIGYDQYMFIGCAEPCQRAVTRTQDLGLFCEAISASPFHLQVDDEPPARPADDRFWAELADWATADGAVILEEGYVANASRWHRLTPACIDAVRAGLTPRSRLTVWPDLSPDINAILAGLPEDDSVIELVWQDAAGRITSEYGVKSPYTRLRELLADARAAMLLSIMLDDRHPLLTAVLPDADGVLRTRWKP